MSFTLTITGTPTTAVAGSEYTSTIVIARSSDDANRTLLPGELVSLRLTTPKTGQYGMLAYPLAYEFTNCAAYVTSSTALSPPQPVNGLVDIVFSGLPKKGSNFTLKVRWKIRETTLGYFESTFAAFYGATTDAGGNIYGTGGLCAATAIPPPPPYQPVVITGLAAVANGRNQIDLSWTDTNTAQAYTLLYKSTDNISFGSFTSTGKGVTTYSATGLTAGTTYYFRVIALSSPPGVSGNQSPQSETVSATTDPGPPVPTGAPGTLTATATKSTSIELAWGQGTVDDEDGWIISRDDETGGPYTEIARVPAGNLGYTDNTCQPLGEYFYIVTPYNEGGSGTASAEASATTPETVITVIPDLGFTFTPGARTKIIQVAGRVMFWSDLDRPVVLIGERAFKMGLKPQQEAPAVAENGTGGLTGTFRAYIMLYRTDGATPSMPGPVSADITVTSKRIKITPQVDPDDPTKIKVRDFGYDADKNEIDGCDSYKIYLYNTGSARGVPVWIATVPITTLDYTTPTDLTATALDDPTREEMPLGFENLLPPACGVAEYDTATSRVRAFGERVMKPNADETAAGAAVVMTAGATTCTVTAEWENVDLDALYHKELYLNKKQTGWFVVDVEGTTLTIRNPDKAKNDLGFAGVGGSGTYRDFAFASPSRVYMSAFFSQGIDAPPQFQPETFPPRYLEAELNPDDNQDPNGAIRSRDVMFLTKQGSVFFTTGGAATDEDDESGDNLPQVVSVTGGSGLLAPKTLCRDRFDVVYGLNDQGPFSLRQSGVTKIGTNAGVAWLMQRFYDVASAAGAVGQWFTREDYLLVCGINRIGNFGGRDWFIYDSRNNTVLPQDFPTRITALEQSPTDSNDYQMLYGDELGNLGVLLTQDVYIDGTNYGLTDPTASEVGIACEAITGQIVPQYGFSPTEVQPNIKIEDQTEACVFTIEYDCLNRSGNPKGFTANKTRTFSVTATRNPDHIPLPIRECQSAKFRLAFTAPRDSRVKIGNLAVVAIEKGAAAGKP